MLKPRSGRALGRLSRFDPGLLFVAGAFAASRFWAWSQGVRFDTRPLDYFWQYLDPTLLRDDLLRSLFYLHSQPPGYNALLGAVLKLGGERSEVAFHFVYGGLGLLLFFCMYRLLVRLGVARSRAALFTGAFSASSTMVLYEHFLFYTYVVAVLLVLGALALHHVASKGSLRWALLFSCVLAAVVCTRSLFHVVWMLGLLTLAAAFGRRAVWIVALPALILVFAIYAKNAAVFGAPATSTWLGMSLWKLTVRELPAEARRELIDAGELSPVAAVSAFSRLSKYPLRTRGGVPFDHPAVARARKSGGHPNFNHWTYIELSRLYLADSLRTLRLHPEVYGESVGRALLHYFIPPTQYRFLRANRAAYAPVDGFFAALSGVPEAFAGEERPEDFGDAGYLVRRVGWLYVLTLGASLVAVSFRVVAAIRSRSRPAETAVLLYLLANAAWVGILANGLELGENNRFLVMVGPLHVMLMVLSLEWAWRNVRRRRAAFAVAGAVLAGTLGCDHETARPNVLLVSIDSLRADRIGSFELHDLRADPGEPRELGCVA